MNDLNLLLSIKIPFYAGILLFGFLIMISINGKLPIIVGIYTAIAFWITTPYISAIGTNGLQLNWALIPIIILSWFFYIKRNRSSVISNPINKFFLIWVMIWICWILSLILFNNISGDLLKTLSISVFFNIILVLIPVLSFSHDVNNIKDFAIAFLITFVIEAIYAYNQLTGVNIINLFNSQTSLMFAGSYDINYHSFARVANIALIFCLTLIVDPKVKSLLTKVIVSILILFSGFIILWSGTRQYMVAASISVLLFLIWALSTKSYWKWLVLITIIILGFVFLFFFKNYQNEIRLDDPKSIAVRVDVYQTMLNWFNQSPLIGNGPYYGDSASTSHGLLLDALASEGLIGFSFLIGFYCFILYYSKGTFKGSTKNSHDIWRIGALLIFIAGSIQSIFSSNVLSAYMVYFGSVLVWGLSPRSIIGYLNMEKNQIPDYVL